MDSNAIRSCLRELRELDPGFTLFGASAHGYRLNSPAELGVMNGFEQKHGASLPDDFKDLLAQCGNGGAGPFYGLFPIGYYDGSGGPLEEWKEAEGVLGTLREPFPHREAWNLARDRFEPPESFDSDDEEDSWHRALDDDYWRRGTANGCFPIAHLGCAYRTVLVVSGPERGNIWTDARAGYEGLFPAQAPGKARCTFAEWYENWLSDCLRELQK